MNKKAFTLIELLAVIVILGLIAAIAIPQVGKYIESSKKSTYVDSVISYGKQVELSNPKELTKTSGISIYSFKDINLDKGDTTKSPYGTFDQNKSFILIHCTQKNCTTYVQAFDSKKKGIKFAELDTITSKNIVDIKDSSEMFTKYEQDVINGYLNRVGDVNRDGTIDLNDTAVIQKHIAGISTIYTSNLKYADVNLDGKVDNNDATLIQKYISDIVSILPIKYGDVNHDNKVSIDDIIIIQKHISGISQLTGNNIEIADVNLDGTIDEKDVKILQNYLNEIITTLPYIE